MHLRFRLSNLASQEHCETYVLPLGTIGGNLTTLTLAEGGILIVSPYDGHLVGAGFGLKSFLFQSVLFSIEMKGIDHRPNDLLPARDINGNITHLLNTLWVLQGRQGSQRETANLLSSYRAFDLFGQLVR